MPSVQPTGRGLGGWGVAVLDILGGWVCKTPPPLPWGWDVFGGMGVDGFTAVHNDGWVGGCIPWAQYDFDTVWEDMHTNARRAHFQLACADHSAQKSTGKAKQVPKDKEEGTSKERKRSADSSNEDGASSDWSSFSLSSCDSDGDSSDDNELLLCFKNF